MTRPTTDELLRRIAIAKAATPGLWRAKDPAGDGFSPSYVLADAGIVALEVDSWDDALHIAASDPPTVIGDLEELLALRDEVARLRATLIELCEEVAREALKP